MRLAELVATSAAVAATRARSAKQKALAELLARLAPDEIEIAAGFLEGSPRQGRIGIGARVIGSARPDAAAREATLTLADVDRAFSELASLSGPGSAARRQALLRALLAAGTEAEQDFLARLLFGELRQGALEGGCRARWRMTARSPSRSVRRAVLPRSSARRRARRRWSRSPPARARRPGADAPLSDAGADRRPLARPLGRTGVPPSSGSSTVRGCRCTATETPCASSRGAATTSRRRSPSWWRRCARCRCAPRSSTAKRSRCAPTAGRSPSS